MTTLDARLEAIRQDLLRELFLGTTEALRERLRPLTEDDRAALNATLSDLLNNLPVMFTREAQFQMDYSQTSIGVGNRMRLWNPDFLYRKGMSEATFFASPQWVEAIEWQSQKSGKRFWESHHSLMESLFTRHRCLALGLAPRKQIVSWFKFPRNVNFLPLFILQPGQVLLDRSAPWTLDVLLTVAKSPRKYFSFLASGMAAPGFAKLLTEVRERFPEWNDRLEPHYAEVMQREGFWNYRTGLQKDIAPEILFAGFLADPLPNNIQGQILSPEPRKLFLELSEKGLISRGQLLESVLNRLVTADRNLIAEGWRQYLIDLAPNDEEKAGFYQRYLDLTGAFSTTAQLALDECVAMWSKGIIPNEDFTGALMAALRHVSQPVCVKAWKLLLKAAGPDDFPLISGAAVDALSAPHKTLRAETIKWLLKNKVSLSADQLGDIAALSASLPTTDRDSLAPLIALTRVEPPPTEAPVEANRESEIAALTAMVAEFKNLRLDAVSRQRLACIEGFLAGQPVGLEAALPNLHAALEIDVHPYESPAALAEGFLETGTGQPTIIHYERLLDGIQRFRDAASETTIRKTIDPLVKQLERIKAEQANPESNFNFWRQRQFPNPACLLAHLWISGQSLADDTDVQRMVAAETLWFRLAVLSLEFEKGFRLALPTHRDGWIHPRVFAERIGALTKQTEQFELLQALYRLPAIPECRAEAWDALPSAYKTSENSVAWILAVALGPDGRFEEAIAALTAFFQANPPNDAVYQQPAYLSQKQAEMLEKRRVQALSSEPNVMFRLFCAALRARFGLADTSIWAEGIPLSKLMTDQISEVESLIDEFPAKDNPMLQSTIARYLFEQKKRSEAERAFGKKVRDRWLFNPETITREALHKRADEPEVFGRDALLAHLSPYLYQNVRAIHSVEYERFPAGAQRFFELGVAGLVPPPLESGQTYNPYRWFFEFNESLIRLGKLPHVDVTFALDELSDWLTNEKLPKRDLVVELFHQWLLDGRAAPAELAAVVALRLRETGKGFTYLDAALGLFSNLSEAGRLFALLACETALASPLSELPARNLSILLDRLERLLDETGRAIPDGPARTNLAALGSAKKKSAVSTKARLLSSRPPVAGQLPAEVAVVFELLKTAHREPLPTSG